MNNARSDSSSSYDGDIWHSSSEDEGEADIEREAAGGATSDAPIASVKGGQTESQKQSTEKEEGVEPAWPTDLCGLGTAEAKAWEAPQRIRTTQLSEEQQRKFRGLLDRIFHPDTLLGQKLIFTPDEITEVVDAVIPIMESEPMLIEDVPFDVTIVGDIHGQLFDLHRVFTHAARDGKPGWECMKYLFLGDYVDRGRQSIEVVMALFCVKCLHPDRIFLLRGNHEFHKINLAYGFSNDIRDRYANVDTAKYLFLLFNEAFCWLSVAAIVGNSYFCAHAGISTSGFTRRQMRGPLMHSDDDTVVHDILWSDPAIGLKGSAFNKARCSSIYFGFDELCKALASMEVVAIFRGHTRLDKGYAVSWNVCYTVFTATNTDQTGNDGAVAYVNAAGRVQIQLLDLDESRVAWEGRLRAVEYLPDEGGAAVQEKTTVDSEGGCGSIINHVTV